MIDPPVTAVREPVVESLLPAYQKQLPTDPTLWILIAECVAGDLI
jgi:hypothetical protein